MMIKNDSNLKKELQEEFSLSDEQVQRIIDQLEGIVEFEIWKYDDTSPDSGNLHLTTFNETDGLPIVHSRKISNYAVNLRQIYKSAELHETLIEIVDDTDPPPMSWSTLIVSRGGLSYGYQTT